MRKLVLLSFVIVASLQFCGAQSLDKMQWFNEPEQWEIKDKSLSMQVTPQSDYWRISHYGDVYKIQIQIGVIYRKHLG